MSFTSIITTVGADKLAATLDGSATVNITTLAVGDGNGAAITPDPSMTSLVHEVYRGTVTQRTRQGNTLTFSTSLDVNTGGFTIREAAIFDSDGDMIAICQTPEWYKTNTENGESPQVLPINVSIAVGNPSSVTVVIDPSVTAATQEYVNSTVTSAGSLETDFNSRVVPVWTYSVTIGSPKAVHAAAVSVPDYTCTAPNYSGPAVVIQSENGYLHVIRGTTGVTLFSKMFGGPNYGRPQIADVNGDGLYELFGASTDGKIWSLDRNGTTRWQVKNIFEREGNYPAGGLATGGTIRTVEDTTKNWTMGAFGGVDEATSGILEIISGTGAGQSRSITWAYGTSITVLPDFDTAPDSTSVYRVVPPSESRRQFTHAGVLSQESGTWYLYVTGGDGVCMKLNADTGSIIWQAAVPEAITSLPVIDDVDGNGVLNCLFVGDSGTVRNFNAATGAPMTAYSLPEGISGSPAVADVDNDGHKEIVVTCKNNRVYALNSSGSVKQKSTDFLADFVNSACPVPNPLGGYFSYATTTSGIMAKLNGTMSTVWSVNGGAPYQSSPCVYDIDGDGELELLQADMTGCIRVLKLTGYQIGAVYVKGSIKGDLLVGDYDNDGRPEIIATTLDGTVNCFRVLP